MQQATSRKPEPLVDDPPYVGQPELPGYELIVSSYILEGILSHESLEVTVLLDDVGGVEVVNIGALHAQGHEDLAAHKESAPALDAERDTLVLCPKLVAELLEANLLDDLETIDRAAPMAVHLELLGNQVTHHSFEPHCLPGKGKPHSSEALDRLL